MRYIWSAILILFSFSAIDSLAQGGKGVEVLYVSYDFPGVEEQKKSLWKLEVFNNNSKFTKTEVEPQGSNVNLKEDEFGEAILQLNFPNRNDSTVYFSSLSDSVLLSREYVFNQGVYDSYIVSETFPKLKWEIRNEFKVVDGNKLQRAETDFRGRHYVAWFSPEHPIFFGPWKLHGLPGLIFELSDDKNRIRYELVRIRTVDYPTVLTLTENKNDRKISLEKYVALKDVDNADEKIKNYILSKLPRGSMVNIHEVSNTNLELVFE